MRNPIQPTPDRPVPLPDCILMDAWWTEHNDRERHGADRLRPITGAREEGPNDRHRTDDHHR